jgi:hemoglobin-like flavoprotein
MESYKKILLNTKLQGIMTQTEINLVQNSWKNLRKIEPQIIGDVFYSKLFLDAPHLKHLFHTPPAEQSKKLINMLNVVIARLEHLDDLKNDIRQLGIRHQSYGVKASHYDIVGNALIWTLQRALGKEWNDNLSRAWIECYTTLASAMIDGAASAHSETAVASNKTV